MPSKLHLLTQSGPLCGRQLSGHRPERAQDQSTMQAAASFEMFKAGLLLTIEQLEQGKKPFSCRWCARVAGLLPPVVRHIRDEQDEEDSVLEGLERELGEEELEDE